MSERVDLPEVLANVLTTFQAGIHTITIGKVTAVGEKLISVKPVINRIINGKSVELAEFVKVPPISLGGGGSSMAFPIAVGDYALLIFTERCFDRWFNGVDFIEPLELRMHDYSDGFALVGIEPFLSMPAIPTETTIKGVMRLGVLNPTDFVALAGKVFAELELIKTDLDAIKTAYDAHIHTAPGGATSVPSVLLPDPHTPESVASAWVKAL